MSLRQKRNLTEKLGMFFLEQGRILTEKEFRLFGQGPVRYAEIKKFYGTWYKAVDGIKIHCPGIWDELHAPEVKTFEILKDEEDL